MNQLPLWETEAPVHHFMELHYYSGERRVIDTANPDDDDTARDRNIYMAGFVSAERALQLPCKPSTRANALRVQQVHVTFGDPDSIRRAIKPKPLTREEKEEMEGCGA